MWLPWCDGTVSALTARKNTGVYYISALSFHTAPCRAQQCWKQDKKYKTKTKTKTKSRKTKTKTEAGLRPVLS